MQKVIHFSIYLISLLFLFPKVFSQKDTLSHTKNYSFVGLEYSVGKTTAANVNFPKLNPQQGFLFSIGKTNYKNNLEWAYQLNYPKTGLTFSFVDLGNHEYLGTVFTIVPYLDFKVLNKWSTKFNLKVGLGASYFTTIYNEIENPNNKAISTHTTWAFRSNLYYDLIDKNKYTIQLGLGYFHNSNGHVRLPNQGLNTFLVSAYSQFNFNKNQISEVNSDFHKHEKTTQKYFSTRVGIGQKVFSKYSTEKKDVYVFSASTGKIINKTFKYGYGLYYRQYKDYHDYINEDGKLVNELYPEFKDNLSLYASNIGVFGNGELLLSHVGVEFELGFNFYKPFYKVDWQINEERYVNDVYQLGELNWYYKVKRTISSRLGAKLYAINANKSPQHNLFLGGFINANLGQADFSEITLGYVYCLPIQVKSKIIKQKKDDY
jgi:hypothetical protein